jgi:hypothetical protein
MIAPFPLQTRLRRALLWFIFFAALFLATTLILRADTPGATRSVPAGGCYCKCAHSKTKLGCTKMCELPRYATRWWATTCAKPRATSPLNNHGAGPRLPHPDHAERASN